jgi:surface protein
MFRAAGANSTLKNVDVIKNWDVSRVTDMSYMFRYRRGLTNFDLSTWNTSSLINASYMFQHSYAT